MSSQEEYKVQLEVFEGPLDLLLYLIKKDELNIYDIPIVRITNQYMQYMDLMRMLDLNIAGEFIVMAATLMMIKSRMLLPPEERAELEAEEDDPRWDLVRQLVEYKKFKDAAIFLQAMSGHDAKDSTSADIAVPDFEAALTGDIRGKKIGIPRSLAWLKSGCQLRCLLNPRCCGGLAPMTDLRHRSGTLLEMRTSIILEERTDGNDESGSAAGHDTLGAGPSCQASGDQVQTRLLVARRP